MGRTDFFHDERAPKANSLVPAAGILAVDDEGRLLLQRRRDTGQWAIPMGKMELGETPTECAVRETHEETGFAVAASDLHLFAVIAEKAPSGIRLPNLPRVLFSSYPWAHWGQTKSLVLVLATVGERLSESQARQ